MPEAVPPRKEARCMVEEAISVLKQQGAEHQKQDYGRDEYFIEGAATSVGTNADGTVFVTRHNPGTPDIYDLTDEDGQTPVNDSLAHILLTIKRVLSAASVNSSANSIKNP